MGSVQRNGFDLQYRLQGSRKPIVFLAGGPGFDVDYLDDAAKLFPAGYQRVFLEQRGTGKSRPHPMDAGNMSLRLAVEDLEALRQHLGLEKLALADHSWGGMLAMAYAASYPDRIERLILIGSVPECYDGMVSLLLVLNFERVGCQDHLNVICDFLP